MEELGLSAMVESLFPSSIVSCPARGAGQDNDMRWVNLAFKSRVRWKTYRCRLSSAAMSPPYFLLNTLQSEQKCVKEPTFPVSLPKEDPRTLSVTSSRKGKEQFMSKLRELLATFIFSTSLPRVNHKKTTFFPQVMSLDKAGLSSVALAKEDDK